MKKREKIILLCIGIAIAYLYLLNNRYMQYGDSVIVDKWTKKCYRGWDNKNGELKLAND